MKFFNILVFFAGLAYFTNCFVVVYCCAYINNFVKFAHFLSKLGVDKYQTCPILIFKFRLIQEVLVLLNYHLNYVCGRYICMLYIIENKIVLLCVIPLGIAVTSASNITTDLVGSNQITDYSHIPHDTGLDPFMVILRCVSGLGPTNRDNNVALGGWYFNGIKVPVRRNCDGPVFEVRGAAGGRYPGLINLYLCGTFTTTEEGVYSCIMMNSSMMEQTMRVGVYISGRSESFVLIQYLFE